MSDYRLYFKGAAGRIEAHEELSAQNDDDAIQAATERRDGRAMELWQHARLVMAFEAQSRGSTATA